MFFFISLIFVVLFYLINVVLSFKFLNFNKITSFERGFLNVGKIFKSLSLHFFIIIIMFVIFDLEVIFILGLLVRDIENIFIFLLIFFFMLFSLYLE